MADEMRALSDELASDPGSQAFLRLGELLRQRGELDAAARVAHRGRERHPMSAPAHDLAARISLDRGDSASATDAWNAVLRLEPAHAGAHKGLGFIAYREGRLREAADHLAKAAAIDTSDASITKALEMVQGALQQGGATPPAQVPAAASDHRSSIGISLFSDIAAGAETVLLLDSSGLVLAGSAPVDGADRSAEIGAHLSGISEEADRAMKHLELGAWKTIVIEAPTASAALSPAGEGGLVMVTAPHSTPLGLLRRMLDRAADRGRTWLAEGA